MRLWRGDGAYCMYEKARVCHGVTNICCAHFGDLGAASPDFLPRLPARSFDVR